MRNIFDTHAHYDEDCFAPNLEQVLTAQQKAGVAAIINCGFHLPSSLRSVALAEQYAFVFAAVGVFPLEAAALPADWLETIRALAANAQVVAIGEIGLDYHAGTAEKDIQAEVFRAQLRLAAQLQLPVQVHTRDADEDTILILRNHLPNGLIHRFASPPRVGRAYLELGLSLGIGCNITYPEFAYVLDTVRTMPLEQLVLETDSPFLPPARLAGQISTSDMIADVAKVIAKTRGDCTPQELLDITCANALRLFEGCAAG